MVAGVALQAQSGFTHAQKVGVGRAMGTVAEHAIFRYRRMLIGKRAAVLRVAAQAELVGIGCAEVIARGASMRIMAIRTTHLSVPQGMVVGQAHLATLRLVTLQASVIGLPPRLNDGLGLGD